MNPTNATAPTSSLRVHAVGLGHIGSRMFKHLQHRGWNVVTFDSLSSSRHSPMCKSTNMLPGNLAGQMESPASALHLPASDRHRAADGKAALP